MSISSTTFPKTRGRKPDANSTSGKIRTLLDSGMEPGEIAKKLGCSASLVYNVKARMADGERNRPPARSDASFRSIRLIRSIMLNIENRT